MANNTEVAVRHDDECALTAQDVHDAIHELVRSCYKESDGWIHRRCGVCGYDPAVEVEDDDD